MRLRIVCGTDPKRHAAIDLPWLPRVDDNRFGGDRPTTSNQFIGIPDDRSRTFRAL
jgi:hypothetical protein